MQIPPYMPTYTPPQMNANLKTEELQELGACSACENRYYQDNSSDGGVSMQQPTKIHPNEAASAVMGHEREHQAREARSATESGKDVVSNTVRLFTSVCPECGRVYVSGGETRTTVRENNDDEQVMSLEDVFASRKI